MKIPLRSLILRAACCLVAALLTGCSKKYEVAVVNHRPKPVVLRIVQYHSEGFDGTPPREFSRSLIDSTREIHLAPDEKSKVVLNDADGGFWLRWIVLELPGTEGESSNFDLLREEGEWTNLDLIRDKRVIDVR